MTLLWIRANAILGGKHVHGYRHPTDDRYFIWVKQNKHDDTRLTEKTILSTGS